MADYELLDQNGQPRYIMRRVRYFDNQLLIDQDFIDDQRYHIDRMRRHERLLHAPGITDGLAVTADINNSVLIGPGSAIDALGRQILIDADIPFTVSREGDLRLYIRFREEESDAAAAETGTTGNTRFRLRPEIDAVEAASLPAYAIVLGTVQLTLDGVKVSVEGRQYAGVRLPAPAGSTAIALRSAGDGDPGAAVLSGALEVTGTLSGAMLTTTNAAAGEGQGGVAIDRSAADREGSLRFETGGLARWSLRLGADGTEDLQLTAASGAGTVQRWDQETGGTTLSGDVSIEPTSSWLTGTGTVGQAAGATGATLTGTGARLQDLLQPGDELSLGGDAATGGTYTVLEVKSQTQVVLDRTITPLTAGAAYPFTYRKNSRILRFAGARQSMIELRPDADDTSERGYLLYRQGSTAFSGQTGGSGRLSLGVHRDQATGEALDLQGGHTLVLNAGKRDSELEATLGASDRDGDAASLSFRVDNDEKASIQQSGQLSIGAGYSGTTTATLLSVGPGGKLTVNSAGTLASAGGVSVGTGSTPFTVNSSGAVTGASGLSVGTGTNRFTVDSTGAVTASTGLSSSGTVTLTGLGAGSTGTQFVRRGSDNKLAYTGSVDLTSGDVTGTLPFGRGGTGATHFATNGVVFGASGTALGSTAAAADSVLVTGSTNVPGLSQTLPSAVQGNITKLGAVTSGSIASGFGNITTPTLNVTTEVQTGGVKRLDASGNLTGIAAVSASGTVTLTGLPAGSSATKFLRQNADNSVATTTGVDLATADVAGTLPFARGGTGTTSFTQNGVVFGYSATALGTTAAAANSVLVTSSTNQPSLSSTLPSAVQGNITKLGDVTSGSIGSGFGNITTPTLNATTALQTGGTTRIDNTGNLSNIGAITATGTVTLSGPATGTSGSSFVRRGTDNKLSVTSSVDLGTADVSGTLPFACGGTGTTTFTQNGVVFGSSATALGTTAAAADSVLITGSTNVPGLSQTLPSAVQGNITKLGAVTAGSIASGFGSIVTTTLNATAAIQTAGTTRIDSSGAISGASLSVGGAVSGASVSAATVNATTGLQTGGTTRIDADGDLTAIGSITATGLISTKNSVTGSDQGGVFIDRSATDREANLRFATNGATRWFLQMDNDSTDNLHLWCGGVSNYLQKWEYNTGLNWNYGDLYLERSGAWASGVGTVKSSTTATSTDTITGVGTSWKTHFQVGDEMAFSGVTGTYYIKQINSDTELVLTASVTGLSPTTAVSYNYKKYSKKLRFGGAKTSMIEFHSAANYGSDRAFILFKDESVQVAGSSAENARLSIGIYNDDSELHGDSLDLQGARMLVLNAGLWDADLDAAIGKMGANPYGLSFRTNNVEHVQLDSGGRFKMRQNATDECIRITGNGTTDTFYSIIRNGTSGTFDILRYSGTTLKAAIYLDDTSSWVKASDRALKENITPLEGSLDRVMQLKPVSFDWKGGGKRSLGFVAQEVEEVFPELVGELEVAEGDRYKTLAEGGLTPVAIAAIQEMKAQFEARIAALEARLAAKGG